MRYWEGEEGLCGIDDPDCEGYHYEEDCKDCINFIPLYCIPKFITNKLGK